MPMPHAAPGRRRARARDSSGATPLASHALSSRPLVVPVGERFEIELTDTGGKRYAYLQLDGQVRLRPIAHP